MISAISIHDISFSYGPKAVLGGVSFDVGERESFALLGPNGSGKTTLFRILSTLVKPQTGRAAIFDRDLRTEAEWIRRHIGVLFQSPSLDKRLTVRENLICHGRLYGLSGDKLHEEVERSLIDLKVADRANDLVGKLSGGLARRAEIAKTLLHAPKLLLLDEPSAGLDPGSRRDLWDVVERLKRERGMTVCLTTHLMDEAEACDRVAILDAGKLIALGTPAELKLEIEGNVLILECRNPIKLGSDLKPRLGAHLTIEKGSLRVEHPEATKLMAEFVERYPDEIVSATLHRPTLEDLFLRKTGHSL